MHKHIVGARYAVYLIQQVPLAAGTSSDMGLLVAAADLCVTLCLCAIAQAQVGAAGMPPKDAETDHSKREHGGRDMRKRGGESDENAGRAGKKKRGTNRDGVHIGEGMDIGANEL